MDSLEKLKRAIIEQVKSHVPVQTMWAECASTNLEQGTMVAKAEGLEYDDVLLGLGPDITVPEVGSKVLVGIVENQREATFLIYAEKITLKRLNGDVHGGLVKAESVTAELNALRQELNTLKSLFTGFVPVPGDGGAALKVTVATWAAATLPPVASQSLQNPIVTHG